MGISIDWIKKQAVLKQLDNMTPGERKELISNTYCLKCWRGYSSCECIEEKGEEKDYDGE